MLQIHQGQAPESAGSIHASIEFFGQLTWRNLKENRKKLKNLFFLCHYQIRKKRTKTVTTIPLIL